MDFLIAEPQHPETLHQEPGVAYRVTFRIVERPIGFHDEPMPKAEKVEDVGAHRDLAAEFQAAELALAQSVPQHPFRRCRVVAEDSRPFDYRVAIHGSA